MLTRAHRDAYDRARAVEIGDDPPLRLDGENASSDHSRQVNIRWLAGTVLTGLAGLGLMGAAIYTSMNGHSRFAKAPGASLRAEQRVERASTVGRKGDRIQTARSAATDEKQTFRISTTTRDGNQEVVRTRPVTRVSASLQSTGSTEDVPKFNPASLFVDTGEPDTPPDDTPLAAEISYVTRDLAQMKITDNDGPVIGLDEVIAKVRDTAALEALNIAELSAGSFGSSPSGTAQVAGLSMATLSNMTVVAKTPEADGTNTDDERVVTVKGHERLEDILRHNGSTAAEARAIAAAFGGPSGYATIGLSPGQKVRILIAHIGKREQPVRVIIEAGQTQSIVALSDTGDFVAVADAPEIDEESDEPQVDYATGGSRLDLYESLYATSLGHGIPEPVIQELVKIFGHDADFQRGISQGDGFEVVYASDEDGKVEGPPEILYSALVSGGETKRYYRYQLDEGGFDYFDEEGRSARKFLLRKPVAQAIMRSGFGSRRHPVLGYSRMHTGVDWAAPRGTQIYAAGNGVVEYAERKGGYGNQIKIRHSNGYETAYGHMSGFARGIKAGTRVRQGQLIGYVGSTGLSTGPHLHFEILVNGRFVNPMRIKVPRGTELAGEALAEFQRERERIDAMVGRQVGSAQITDAGKRGG